MNCDVSFLGSILDINSVLPPPSSPHTLCPDHTAWPVARPWADKLLAEFAEQTETEIANNLPVTEWMRTVNVVQPKMQVRVRISLSLPYGSLVLQLLSHFSPTGINSPR